MKYKLLEIQSQGKPRALYELRHRIKVRTPPGSRLKDLVNQLKSISRIPEDSVFAS